MKEIFREIAGYKGLYEASNLGNVRRIAGKGCNETRVLKPNKDTKGYLYVNLYKDGKRKHHSVHRLVAETFIENPYNLPEVNHIDEDKMNNRIDNLEWCDRRYNMNYGTGHKRSAKAQSEEVLQLTLDYVFVKEWESTKECGRNGFDSGAVSKCCRNEYGLQKNVYNGYRWVYAKDYYKTFA